MSTYIEKTYRFPSSSEVTKFIEDLQSEGYEAEVFGTVVTVTLRAHGDAVMYDEHAKALGGAVEDTKVEDDY
jgi:hypothetical protein